MSSENKRYFFCKITYFKPSGKFYTEGEFWCATTDCGSVKREDGIVGPPSCYMPEVVDFIQKIQSTDGETLPGLASGNHWEGPILVTCDMGYPVLFNFWTDWVSR